MKKEQWKDILGYQGDYQVSSKGNIKSFKSDKAVLLKPKLNKQGYLVVKLSNKGKAKSVRVHRLVAYAFCKGYKKGLQVNHIDGNKLNNYFKNLEWCTQSENCLHAYKLGLMVAPRNRLGFSGKLHRDSMPVIQLSLDNKLIAEFESIGLTKHAGFTPQHVQSCCAGKLKTHKKFKWQYKQN